MTVSPGVSLKVDRAAMDRLFQSIHTVARASAEVGYFNPTPVPEPVRALVNPSDSTPGATKVARAPLTVIELAAIHEYGTAGIPSRPFMRHAMESAKPLLERVAAEELAKVADGKISPTRAMVEIGDAAAGRVLDTLETTKQWAKPNAPLTVALKGGDTPLYAGHGTLREELRFTVLDAGKVLLTEKPSR